MNLVTIIILKNKNSVRIWMQFIYIYIFQHKKLINFTRSKRSLATNLKIYTIMQFFVTSIKRLAKTITMFKNVIAERIRSKYTEYFN